jgi:hypothetical protein
MALQKYDPEFKPTNIMKYTFLCKMVTEALDSRNHPEDGWQEELSMCTQQLSCVPTLEDSSYNCLKKCLQHGTAIEHLNYREKIYLQLKYAHYHLGSGVIFRRNYDGLLLKCLEKQDANKFIK